ncbi:MAG: YraN family protein [Acidimicrobiales bacterium]
MPTEVAMSAGRTRTELALRRGSRCRVVPRAGLRGARANWFCPPATGGELDVIVKKGSLVVICEVKTRTSTRFGYGHEAVGWSKQQQVRKLATIWLHETASPHRGYVELRFDVADVDASGHVRMYEQAF